MQYEQSESVLSLVEEERVALSERTKIFALRIIRLFDSLPKQDSAKILGRQLLRSGTSIGANYREANRSRSNAEFISKIGECLREADETAYWLELLSEAQILPPTRLHDLQDETNQLIAILTAISKKVKSRTP